jgi:hypothetical protein
MGFYLGRNLSWFSLHPQHSILTATLRNPTCPRCWSLAGFENENEGMAPTPKARTEHGSLDLSEIS